MPRQTGLASHYWGIPRRAGDQRRETFAELVDRYRGRIHLLCYRLTGSFEDAIRLSYDTFLTGWRLRHSAPADLDGWLTAMAVRACVEHTRRHRPAARTDLPADSCIPRGDVTWLQPYPDRLLPDDVDPDTVGLPFVAASQSLTPRDRATLVLTDIEGWSLSRTAGALRMPNADAEPRLERARATVRAGWTQAATGTRWSSTTTGPRHDGTAGPDTAARPDTAGHDTTGHDDAVEPGPDSDGTGEPPDRDDPVTGLIGGFAAADVDRIEALLHDQIQVIMPPLPFSFEGRPSAVGLLAQVFRTADPDGQARRRCIPTRANRQPAFAVYIQRGAAAAFHGHELVVARSDGDRIVELTMFEPRLLPVFGLPTDL